MTNEQTLREEYARGLERLQAVEDADEYNRVCDELDALSEHIRRAGGYA